jgi:trimeric autotransporter adhesin
MSCRTRNQDGGTLLWVARGRLIAESALQLGIYFLQGAEKSMTTYARLFAVVLLLLLPAAVIAQTAPVITSVSPSEVYVNSSALTLTFTGMNFAPTDLVCLYNFQYGCEYLVFAYVSSTQLTIQLLSGFASYAADYDFYVIDSSGDYSNLVVFSVVPLTPTIGPFSPTSVVRGSTPSPIIVNGTFMQGATVQWNGKTLATTFISPNQLEFTPTKEDLANAAMVPITVTNPSPGGTSNEAFFNVTYKSTILTLDLPANDIVWDPYAELLYASLPSSYGPNGNSIAVIRPTDGKILGYYFAGSEPNQLALSSDSQYLYVGLNGNGSVQRLILPNFTPDIDVSLGTGDDGINLAGSLQVSPSDDHTWAVDEVSGCCYDYGIYFFSDSTKLPNSITYPDFEQILFVSSGTLYAYSTYAGVAQVAVTADGGTLGTEWSGLVEGSEIWYANGLIYGNGGQVLDPASGLLLGTYDVTPTACCGNYDQLLPSPTYNRVFAVGTTPFSSSLGVTAYDLDEFTPLATASLSQLNANSIPNAILWGADGIAMVVPATPPQLALLTSSDMLQPGSTTKNPHPSPTSLSPASLTHGGWNFILTVSGTDFAPAASVTWNGVSLTTAYISSTELDVYVPYTDIASAGTAQIVVKNPAPGGGKSTALTITIN